MQIKRPESWNKHSLALCHTYLFGNARGRPSDVIDDWIFWAESQGWQFEPPSFILFAHQEAMLEWGKNFNTTTHHRNA